MKNLGKELNKAKREVKKKLTKKDLEHFTPQRIADDLHMIDQLVSKMSSFSFPLSKTTTKTIKNFCTYKHNFYFFLFIIIYSSESKSFLKESKSISFSSKST